MFDFRLIDGKSGRNRSLVRALVSRRYFASSPEELAKRNYANDLSEYNTVVNSVTAQRRFFLFFSLSLQFLCMASSSCLYYRNIQYECGGIENLVAIIMDTWFLDYLLVTSLILVYI